MVGSALKDLTSATVGVTAVAGAFNTAKIFTGIVDKSNKSLRIMKGAVAMDNDIRKMSVAPVLANSLNKAVIQPGNSTHESLFGVAFLLQDI